MQETYRLAIWCGSYRAGYHATDPGIDVDGDHRMLLHDIRDANVAYRRI